ncbi:trypsin-like serine protease [Flocculibacter collagenilyticus]|uniref:trypsin-like serine protease n=1 Tax=Flocculibacter collagenilyticus TaxID=2744479 RepID=UPI0018F37AD7|nr:trypsin-like serine protease [Flocculibacter collagenilyticus]
MKKFLLAAIPAAMVLAAPTTYAKNVTISPVKPKIVGGEEATEGVYPWMAAIVATAPSVATSLKVGENSIETSPFSFSPAGAVSGELASCELGDAECTDVEDKVCLIERGTVTFAEKANNCEAGGGVGVVIYNNVEGHFSGTLGEGFEGTIPVVGITQADGQALLDEVATAEKAGSTAAIEVSAEETLTQNSSCGASFLGDRWVLTAAHCVDSPNSINMKVNVGEFDLADGAEDAIEIKNLYLHPGYDTNTLHDDIALIELAESVDKPTIKIADLELTSQLATDNSVATSIGWGGRTGYLPGEGPTSDFPEILHEVDLQLYSSLQCRTIIAESRTRDTDFEFTEADVDVTEQMICAGTPAGGLSTCQGDSGGPLIVNTNDGWQQVGVVSWGLGCAAPGYPGVYTRAGAYQDWMDGITDGIAITQLHDFTTLPETDSRTFKLMVENNSGEAASVTYEIEGSSTFTVEEGACNTLAAGETCELSATYTPVEAGAHEAFVVIKSDNAALKSSKTKLMGNALASASDLKDASGSTSEEVSLFTGGDVKWEENAEGGLQSGDIDDGQESILMAEVNGEGKLTFEWGVSSEENVEDPAEPWDALYLTVNGELHSYISGDVAFESVELELPEGKNLITWSYIKDGAVTELEDTGYVRNINFAKKEPIVIPQMPITEQPDRRNAGGSLGWLSLSLFGLALFRRRK